MEDFFMHEKQILNVLRAKEASQYIGVAESTFWKWVKENKLPKGKKISPRVTLWLKSDLDNFLGMAQEAAEQA